DRKALAPVITERPYIAAPEFVSTNCFADCFFQLLLAIGDSRPVRRGRGIEPLEVRPQPEYRRPVRRLVAANALEDAAAIVQSMGRNVQRGVLPPDRPPVHPDPYCFVKRHVSLLIESAALPLTQTDSLRYLPVATRRNTEGSG